MKSIIFMHNMKTAAYSGCYILEDSGVELINNLLTNWNTPKKVSTLLFNHGITNIPVLCEDVGQSIQPLFNEYEKESQYPQDIITGIKDVPIGVVISIANSPELVGGFCYVFKQDSPNVPWCWYVIDTKTNIPVKLI